MLVKMLKTDQSIFIKFVISVIFVTSARITSLKCFILSQCVYCCGIERVNCIQHYFLAGIFKKQQNNKCPPGVNSARCSSLAAF